MQCISRFAGSFLSPVLYQLSYLSGSVHDRQNRASVIGREHAMIGDRRQYHGHTRQPAHATSWLCVFAVLVGISPAPARAGETPDSANVKKLVNSALQFLQGHTDDHLGGK